MATPTLGLTIPLGQVPLAAQREWYQEAAELGYTEFWTGEVDGSEAFIPLALAAAWVPSVRVGCAISSVFTRGPALLAMSAATMAAAAPGRFALGIGTSSAKIVEKWNDIPFDRPYHRTRDMVRFLREALTGVRVDRRYETFAVRGFRLGLVPETPPPLLVAALRPQMLRLAGREADGAIVNWLGIKDVPKVAAEVAAGAAQRGGSLRPEIVARIFVCPCEDDEWVRTMLRPSAAVYLNVPVYAAFHEWLGRGELMAESWRAWKAGDRAAAGESIPDEVLDDLIVHGSPASCRAQLAQFVDSGVTTPMLVVIPPPGGGPDGLRQAIRDLAPPK